jgi:AcrR family transcriptional regulator
MRGMVESSPQTSASYAKKKALALDAAAAVFARKGFHGASTKDIADEMGIKQGSLYYYFDSKEQALKEVCEDGFILYAERMQRICEKQQPFEAKMYAIVSSHLSAYRQKRNALIVHNDQRLYLAKENRTLLKDLGTRYRQQLEQTLKEGIDQGVLSAELDTHFIAYSIILLCNSWGGELIRHEEIDLYDTIERCSDLILRGILKKQN